MRLLCSKCGEKKGLHSFSPEPRNVLRQQRRSHCKLCCCLAARERWRRDVGKSRARTRAAYARDPIKCMAVSNVVQRVSGWWKFLVVSARTRCKKKHDELQFDIDADYVLSLYKKQNGLCYWFGVPMIPSTIKREPQRPSLDRLVPELGYVRGNVVLTCMFANLGRSQASIKQTREFIEVLRASWLVSTRIAS